MKSVLLVFYGFLGILLGLYSQVYAQEYQLGEVRLTVTGDDVAMPYFYKGLLLLHNFEYEDAAGEFEMAQLLDPNLTMAYWGEAMCYYHPLWVELDTEKGKGALFKLGVKAADRKAKAKTDIEKGFIAALEKLYVEDGREDVRKQNYKKSMEALYDAFPDNEEVGAFYALALMAAQGEANGDDNKALAGKILMKINAVNPRHPGVLNYLIQLYDTPSEAYKARKYADEYYALAPDSKFALHIPTHIFLALGQWDKVVRGNLAAWNVAESWVKKNKKSLEDRDYHALWWLEYGYLQQGKYKKALELITNMNRDARYSKSERMRFHLAMMRGHYLSETGQWRSPVAQIQIPTRGFNVSTKNMCFFVDAMSAMQKGDFSKVQWYINQMTDQRMVEKNKKSPYNDFRICSINPKICLTGLEDELALAESMEWELKALLAQQNDKPEEAIGNIEKAASLEDRAAYQPGPPVVIKPAHELYGELLLANGSAKEAVAQFDIALQHNPNRSLSLLGKYKALKKLGETQKAAAAKKLLMTNWQMGDEEVKKKLN